MVFLGHRSPELICTVQAPTLLGTYCFSFLPVVLGFQLWFLYVCYGVLFVCKSDYYSSQPAATPKCWVCECLYSGQGSQVLLVTVLGGS